MALTTEQSSLPSTDEADKISSLVTSANLQYSLKNYDAASELYSRATELQAEKNGDMAPENADILYLYGRCLYKVALSKSNVLGATVAGPSEQKPKKKSKAEKGESSKSALPPANVPGPADADQKLAEDIVEAAVENKEGMKEDKDEKTADKPFFMITGDDNWDTDSDEEEQGEEGEGEDEGDQEEGEDDDFATAYEILEVARVLLQRQIEGVSSEATNGSAAEDVATAEGRGKAPAVQPISEAGSTTDKSRAIKERLADTHDLLAEISLENERFVDAIPDSRASLALKKELHPPDSSLLAEAHFKLSLALEFASVTKLREAAEKQQEKQQEELRQKLQSGGVGEALATLAGGSGQEAISGDVDEGLREEAAVEMELAIASSKLRVEKEEAALRSKDSPEDKKKLEADIADVKEMIDEMEQRLADLRAPAIRIPTVIGTAGSADEAPLGGVLGSILGESPAEQQARLEEAKKGANDLSGLVRKKKPAAETAKPAATAEPPQENSNATNGKRKLDETDDDAAVPEAEVKKAKVEDILN